MAVSFRGAWAASLMEIIVFVDELTSCEEDDEETTVMDWEEEGRNCVISSTGCHG